MIKMGTNYNSNVSEELRDVLKIQQNVDNIPKFFQDTIVPVVDVNPKHARVCNIVRYSELTNGTTVTIYTTPASKSFYLTSIMCSYIKDATSQSTSTNVRAYIEGVQYHLINFRQITLTLGSDSVAITFNTPIKIDSETAITLQNSSNVANISCSACITGYTVDNIRA